MGASLVTIPLTLRYLGNERFGLWMTLSSMLAMAGFADFGIGNGVLNAVSTAFGKDDWEAIRRAISSGFAILSLVGLVLLVLFLMAYSFVDWGDLYRATSASARAEAGPATLVFGVCFILNIPLDVVQRTQLGLQQGFLTSLWQVFSSFMLLGGILLAVYLKLGLTALVFAFAGAPVLGTAINLGYFFGFRRRDLAPQWSLVSRGVIKHIAGLGGLFFILQLVGAVSFAADNFIIARILGVDAVTIFSIPQRMFATISLIVAMFTLPLWPAYGEAVSRGDMLWVRQTLYRSLLAVFAVTSILAAMVVLLSDKLLLWWVGPTIHPAFAVLLGLAVWTVLSNCGSALAVFLNGAGVTRFQLIFATAFGAVCLIAKIVFTRHYGIVAVPWATIVVYVFLTVVPYSLYLPVLLARMDKDANAASARRAAASL